MATTSFRLVLAQEAVIDEDAGELVADGFMDQGGRHRAVDAARQRRRSRASPT